MKVKFSILILFAALISAEMSAQFSFTGMVEDGQENGNAYLSLVEDYRKISGVYPEQVISKFKLDGSSFNFTGNNLEPENRIYRIHIDYCNDNEQGLNHFNGDCPSSREILFIANNKGSIDFPISSDKQMFCSISSNNKNAHYLFQIDSLKELMRYDYGKFRSLANRRLNNKKWFEKLQEFGLNLDEPLAELYIYNFLSDRRGDLYDYYLEDLAQNPYYDKLLKRLKIRYPNSSYTRQYASEISSDRYMNTVNNTSSFSRAYVLYFLLVISILANIFFWFRFRAGRSIKEEYSTSNLTQQEQKILDLILQGKTNKEIASEIFISLSTVKTHINNLYRKLDLQSRDELKQHFSTKV